MKAILKKPELVLALHQQLFAIKAGCNEYDLGNQEVIQSIAADLILLFHNSDQSKSLLSQLKLNHLQFFCSSETYDSKSLINFIGLLKLKHQPGKGWTYVAELDHSVLKKVSPDNWWNNKKVIIDSDGVAFTRSKIIQSAARGVLPELDTSGWKLKDKTGNKVNINPIPEAIRQIAFELLASFENIDVSKESRLHYKP